MRRTQVQSKTSDDPKLRIPRSGFGNLLSCALISIWPPFPQRPPARRQRLPGAANQPLRGRRVPGSHSILSDERGAYLLSPAHRLIFAPRIRPLFRGVAQKNRKQGKDNCHTPATFESVLLLLSSRRECRAVSAKGVWKLNTEVETQASEYAEGFRPDTCRSPEAARNSVLLFSGLHRESGRSP
jgi:hypothetical protein